MIGTIAYYGGILIGIALIDQAEHFVPKGWKALPEDIRAVIIGWIFTGTLNTGLWFLIHKVILEHWEGMRTGDKQAHVFLLLATIVAGPLGTVGYMIWFLMAALAWFVNYIVKVV